VTTSKSVGLVGGHDELAALGADRPAGTLVALTGECGSGRTALLDDVNHVPNPVPLVLTAREVGHRVIAAAAPFASCDLDLVQ
jgi:hypothetical protein